MTHYGWGPAGTAEHKGNRQDCAAPDCLDAEGQREVSPPALDQIER